MKKLFHRLLFSLLLILASVSGGFAQNITTWVSNWLGDLYSVDVSTCQAQLIGTLDPNMKDLAYNPVDGNLYGLFSGSIYLIDQQTANSTYVDAITQQSWNGFFTSMTCDEFGMLYIVTDQGFVYTYDTNTSSEGYLGTISSYGAAGDATFYNGTLIFTSLTDELVTVDLSNITASYSNGNYSGLTNVLGIVSYTDCISDSSVLLAMPDNDIYEVDFPSLVSNLICPDIVPGVIYGAATTSETGCDTSCTSILTPIFTLDSVICEGDLVADFPTVSNNGLSGTWLPPINNMATTNYQFFPDSLSCVDTISQELLVLPIATTDILGTDNFVDTITSYTFIGTPSGGNWTSSCYECIDPNSGEFFPVIAGIGTHEICYTPAASCTEESCITVSVNAAPIEEENFLIIPNVFTPNGDLDNEVYQITEYSSTLTDLHCEIFNRWGELVATIDSPQDFWNGLDNHENEVTEGTYFCKYEAIFMDGEVIKGQSIVQLIRN